MTNNLKNAGKLRLLLADDHSVLREGLKNLLNQVPVYDVVGDYDNAKQLCESARSLQPDLIVLDVSMPNSKCTDTIHCLRRDCPEARILMLTMYDDMAYLNLCLEAGASGYVLKGSSTADVLQAINTIVGGGVYIDPAMARKLADRMTRTQNTVNDAVSLRLSNRETEVLRLVARGHTNKEISELVAISEKTVETYKARAMEKLGLTRRSDVLRYALTQGWLENL